MLGFARLLYVFCVFDTEALLVLLAFLWLVLGSGV